MSSTHAARMTPLRGRSSSRGGAAAWRSARSRRRALRTLLAAPVVVQLLFGAIVVVPLWFAANGVYQVARKPTELFFPVSGTLDKTPAETWRQYAPTFRAN